MSKATDWKDRYNAPLVQGGCGRTERDAFLDSTVFFVIACLLVVTLLGAGLFAVLVKS